MCAMVASTMRHSSHPNHLLPTVAMDFAPRPGATTAEPVPGFVNGLLVPSPLPTPTVAIRLASEVRASIAEYRLHAISEKSRIYALPAIGALGKEPVALRIATQPAMAPDDISQALHANHVIARYWNPSDGLMLTYSPPTPSDRFHPQPALGYLNVPVREHGDAGDVSRRGGLLLPLVHGSTLHTMHQQGQRLAPTQAQALFAGLYRWINVAARFEMIHTNLKPSHIIAKSGSTELVAVDHALIGIDHLVASHQGRACASIKTTAHWYNGSGFKKAVDHYEEYGNRSQLLLDCVRAQRATAARIALEAALGHEATPAKAYASTFDYYNAINTPSAYEPALERAIRLGVATETVVDIRTCLYEGLQGTTGLNPGTWHFPDFHRSAI